MKTKTKTNPGPVHKVIEEPLRPINVSEVHLYVRAKRNPKTGRMLKALQYDVLFVLSPATLAERPDLYAHKWINGACKDFAQVVTNWMLAGQAAAMGDVMYHAAWDRGWTWRIM